ncbi:MAG: HYR domain-containing protein [Acidobacteria bacterium]|nr:HYR domain-containing protein [Acidobacteriota bacterium]
MSWPIAKAPARRAWLRLLLVAVVAALAAACGEDAPPTPTGPVIQPFALQCPADVVGQSFTGAPVTIQVPTPTTSGGVLPVTGSCSPTGTTFPVGSTRVSCQATDARGAAASCTFNINIAPPPLSRTNFLAFGDSTTSGEITVPTTTALDVNGFPQFKMILVPSQSYPTKLLTLLRSRYTTQASQFVVTNAGLPREWVVDGARRLPGVLASTSPQVVLLLEGANDLQAIGVAGIEPALLALRSMVRAARARGAAVFVASLPPPRAGGANTLSGPQVQTLNALISSGAVAEGATFVDLYAALAPNVPLYIGIDGLHPTEAGYQRMAETFFAAIRNAFEGR